MINIYQLLYSMNKFNDLASPIGLCNDESIKGGAKIKIRTNEERETHTIDSNFFDMLFDKVYSPMNITTTSKTRKNRL
jgi:hypothetical protein